MITTVGSANIYLLNHIDTIKREEKKSLLMITLRVYPLENFPKYQTAMIAIAIVLYIMSPLLITGSLCLLTTFL